MSILAKWGLLMMLGVTIALVVFTDDDEEELDLPDWVKDESDLFND
jgi:hypothetical protein